MHLTGFVYFGLFLWFFIWTLRITEKRHAHKKQVGGVDKALAPKLQAMGLGCFSEYHKTLHWQRINTAIKKDRPWTCYACGADKDLHITHKTYSRLGKESLRDLVVLCKPCQEEVDTLIESGITQAHACTVYRNTRHLLGLTVPHR